MADQVGTVTLKVEIDASDAIAQMQAAFDTTRELVPVPEEPVWLPCRVDRVTVLGERFRAEFDNKAQTVIERTITDETAGVTVTALFGGHTEGLFMVSVLSVDPSKDGESA